MRKPSHLFRTVASFLVSLLLNSVAVVAGGFVWRGQYNVQVTALVLTGVLLGGYLAWRVFVQRARLPHTRFGWVFAAGLAAGLLSAAFSPDPRLAWPRLALLGFYVLLFYVLLDALEDILDREAVLQGALAVGWIVGLLGFMEVFYTYYNWFQAAGSWHVMPAGTYRLASVFGYSNEVTPYINLLAPLALVALLKTRRRAVRVYSVSWLLFYGVMLAFSSSRGGLIGCVVWVGVLLLCWIWRKGPRRVWGLVWGERSWLARLAWLPALAAAGYAGWRVWLYFSNHASHGFSTGLFDTRNEIWGTAWAIFASHPWLGVGPGRFAYAYLAQNGQVPPGFWALHAHSLPIEVLAEFGLVGFGVLVAGAAVFAWQVWGRLRAAGVHGVDGFDAAALAGVTSLAVHAVAEDPTRIVPAMGVLVLLVAWVLLPSGAKLPRWERKEIETTHALQGGVTDLHEKNRKLKLLGNLGMLPMRVIGLWVLFVPGVVLLGFSAWSVWTYQPMAAALPAVAQKDWGRVAQGITASANRDPQFVFYQVEAGLAWAQYWQASQNPAALDLARAYLLHSLELEPAISQIWANKAVLDWQAGDLQNAVMEINIAIQLAPQQTIYYLNRAYFEEDTGQLESAFSDYQKVLDMAPAWVGHPFFAVTALRQQAMIDWQAAHPQPLEPATSYWAQAVQALQAGDLPGAELQATRSAWLWEDPVSRQQVLGMIAEAKGNPEAAMQDYQLVASALANTYPDDGSQFTNSFNLWLNDRNGLLFDLVPGFLQIRTNQGQAELLIKLSAWYRGKGQCTEAAQAWEALQRFTYAGALQSGNKAPACP